MISLALFGSILRLFYILLLQTIHIVDDGTASNLYVA